jgi:hypothetical protein
MADSARYTVDKGKLVGELNYEAPIKKGIGIIFALNRNMGIRTWRRYV